MNTILDQRLLRINKQLHTSLFRRFADLDQRRSELRMVETLLVLRQQRQAR